MSSQPTDTQEPIYSYGTDQAIETLSHRYYAETEPAHNAFINVATIVRNSTDKASNIKDSFESVSKQILNIGKVLSANMASARNMRGGTLVFYTGNYSSMVPPAVLRNQTDYLKLCSEVNNKLIKDMRKMSTLRTNGIDIKYEVLPDRTASFNSLATILRKCPNNGSVYLLSHYAIDYHVHKRYPNFKIVSSYTGDVLTAKNLSSKVFTHPEVGFTPETHALLGDKELIKSLLSIPQKRQLYQIAAAERWDIRTGEFIQSSLRKHGFIVPFKFV